MHNIHNILRRKAGMRKIKQIAGVAFTISSVLGLVWLAKNLERILVEEEQMREERAYLQG